MISKSLKNLQNNFNMSVTLATLSVTVLAKRAAHIRNERCVASEMNIPPRNARTYRWSSDGSRERLCVCVCM